MNNETNESHKMSISTDEYFSFKTEKLQKEIEARINSKSKKSQFVILAITLTTFFVFGTALFVRTQEQLSYVERFAYRSEKSEYLLEEALLKLERSARQSEDYNNELSLLKKEVLALKLSLENLQARIESSHHSHEVDGKRTKESGI